MEKEERILGYLGLGMRARQVSTGEFAVLELVKRGKASIVFIDEGLGVNTSKKIMNACAAQNVTLHHLSVGKLGHSIGDGGKKVAAFAQSGIAEKIKEIITQDNDI